MEIILVPLTGEFRSLKNEVLSLFQGSTVGEGITVHLLYQPRINAH